MKVYLETYGCAAAQSDSEIMAGLLVQAKHKIIDNIEQADYILIVTCDVKAVTEQKILDRLKILKQKYPNKKFIIAGCMIDNREKKIKAVIPSAILISTHQIANINQAINTNTSLLDTKASPKTCLPRLRRNKEIGIVQISEGCRGACSFCSTRLAKGIIHSYPMQAILDDIKSLVTDGCTKIYLTSQDTGAYGFDLIGKTLLPELLQKASTIPGNFVIRVGMMNPDNIISALPDLINAYRNKKIMKFLHLPVQSGSNEILKAMNRRYSVQEFKSIVSSFRQSYPDLILWTDIIVGYPGETEAQFEQTLSLLSNIKPNYTNVSRFAKREGTVSAKLKQLPTDEMKHRTRLCSELVQKLKH